MMPQNNETLPPTSPILVLVVGLATASIFLTVYGMCLAFQDMFGGPAPPEASFCVIIGMILAVVAEGSGIIYLRQWHEKKATVASGLLVVVAMFVSTGPLILLVITCLNEISQA